MSISWIIVGAGLVAYLAVVRHRRFARVKAIERQYAHLVVDPSRMTYNEAVEIQKVQILYESPWLAKQALEFALFQTYAIPTISGLLAQTGRLTCPAVYGKRAEDTGILILEMTVHGPDCERGSVALSRINWLHGRYGSKISRDDMLFTLSLFIYEPLRIVAEHDWRPPTKLERQARFVFWREVGTRMGIADIPKTSDELVKWCAEYTAEKMVFAESNAVVGAATFALFLRPYPRILQPYVRQALLTLVPDIVLEAFGWPRASPAWLYTFVPAVLAFRAFLIRNFFLPRTVPADQGLLDPNLTTVNEKGETLHRRDDWFFDPLYVKPTLKTRLWSLLGHPSPGAAYQPEGYRVETCGPKELEHLGMEKVKADAEKARTTAQGGACPFAP